MSLPGTRRLLHMSMEQGAGQDAGAPGNHQAEGVAERTAGCERGERGIDEQADRIVDKKHRVGDAAQEGKRARIKPLPCSTDMPGGTDQQGDQ